MDALWTWFISHMTDESKLVVGAPVLSLLALVMVVAVVWVITRSTYGARLGNVQSILDLRNAQLDDYKNKLSGATPDEAKARLDTLEQRVARLVARRLTQAQRERISSILRSSPATVCIVNDMSVADAAAYATDIAAAFQQGGWAVRNPAVLGAANPAPCGLAVRIPAAVILADPPQQSVLQAFDQAEVEYELQRPNDLGPIAGAMAGPIVAEILITTRVI